MNQKYRTFTENIILLRSKIRWMFTAYSCWCHFQFWMQTNSVTYCVFCSRKHIFANLLTLFNWQMFKDKLSSVFTDLLCFVFCKYKQISLDARFDLLSCLWSSYSLLHDVPYTFNRRYDLNCSIHLLIVECFKTI